MTREEEFVMRWFRDYYAKAKIQWPSCFEEREFGFMFFDKDFVRRHVGFQHPDDLRKYLVHQIPRHVYYSSAHYERPAAPKMEQKGWLGADLVFDLDADHIKGAEKMTFSEMLVTVKKDMIRLLDQFLLGDLGFDEKDVRICFSGGRGYHAHISSQKVQKLRSHERSEIVDYVSGTDLDLDWIFESKASMKKDFKSHIKIERAYNIPEEGAGGWRGHVREGIKQLFEEFQGMTPDEARNKYPSFAKTKEQVLFGLQVDLYDDRGSGKRGMDLIMERNSLEYISDRNKEDLLNWFRSEIKGRLAAEVDEPVTRDIKRLIRMPYSLHGKTGLRVISMSRDDLTDFDPLRDAFPDIFPDHPIKVMVDKPVDVVLKGERIQGQGMLEVPTYAAIFMILRMKASLA